MSSLMSMSDCHKLLCGCYLPLKETITYGVCVCALGATHDWMIALIPL